jgi:hypothetical protein
VSCQRASRRSARCVFRGRLLSARGPLNGQPPPRPRAPVSERNARPVPSSHGRKVPSTGLGTTVAARLLFRCLRPGSGAPGTSRRRQLATFRRGASRGMLSYAAAVRKWAWLKGAERPGTTSLRSLWRAGSTRAERASHYPPRRTPPHGPSAHRLVTGPFDRLAPWAESHGPTQPPGTIGPAPRREAPGRAVSTGRSRTRRPRWRDVGKSVTVLRAVSPRIQERRVLPVPEALRGRVDTDWLRLPAVGPKTVSPDALQPQRPAHADDNDDSADPGPP